MPTYVVDEHPEFATVEGLKENAATLRDRRDGRQGPVPRRRTRASSSSTRRSSQNLGLDLEVVVRGIRRRRSLVGARYGVQNEEPLLMLLVDAALGEREVRPRRGRAARVRRGVRGQRSTNPTGDGYACDYADDVLYKAFSAELEREDPSRVRVPLEHRAGRRKTRRGRHSRSTDGRSPRRPRRHGWTPNQDVWQPGCAAPPDRRDEGPGNEGRAPGRPPRRPGVKPSRRRS